MKCEYCGDTMIKNKVFDYICLKCGANLTIYTKKRGGEE